MKRIVWMLIGALCFSQVMAQKTVINDPNVEVRAATGYHGIRVSNAIDLYLSQGDQEAVAVSAADVKWRDRIRVEVIAGILHIYVETKGLQFGGGNHKLKAYVSFTHLDKLNASGASDVYVDGVISGENLDITLSGASDFKGAVKVSSLKLDQSGASDAQIIGTVSGFTEIECSGASDLKGYELVTETCTAKVSGASDIRITVNRELNANATGASSIYYKGDAIIKDLHSSGSSSVSRKS